MTDIGITRVGHVALVEIHRAPNNYFDLSLIRDLADTFEQLDGDPTCRATVLASEGRNFCAGADFSGGRADAGIVYEQAVRIFRAAKPCVAAVQGSAIGGGLGLALVADFRVTSPEARFCANFARLGFHPGFGLSVTLPRAIGQQRAALMFYTGRRVEGTEAVRMGLADVLVETHAIRDAAIDLAKEISVSAPAAVRSVRQTLRLGLADAVALAVRREWSEQERQFASPDFDEGIRAMSERRPPVFEDQ